MMFCHIEPDWIQEMHLPDLFNFFYDSQLVEEEDLNRAFNKQLDRLKNPVEESDTSDEKE